MVEAWWLILLGLLLSIFDILFGAISGLDIFFLGIAFMFGGIVHLFTASWQAGTAFVGAFTLVYTTLIRGYIRKKALLLFQSFGMDFLIGKSCCIIVGCSPVKKGKALLDGEIFETYGDKLLKENEKALVIALKDTILVCTRYEP